MAGPLRSESTGRSSVPPFALPYKSPHEQLPSGNALQGVSRKRKRKRNESPIISGSDVPYPNYDESGDAEGIQSAENLRRNQKGFISQPRPVENLRQRHLNVLTTILHECLLARDFHRARRAWSMLLRTEYSGRLIDVRIHNRWTIGSEVLFSYGVNPFSSSTDFKPPQLQDLESRSDLCRVAMKASFSHSESKKAKEYFERLILQYPHRKALPNALGECELYVTMFSLWIYSIQEQYMIRQSHTDLAFEVTNGTNQGNDKEPIEAYEDILSDANEVMLRLDELLLSPPYSDNHRLWNLLGMLALWKVHLLSRVRPPREGFATGDIEESALSPNPSLVSRQKEVMQKARKAFIQVSRLGGLVKPGLKEDLNL